MEVASSATSKVKYQVTKPAYRNTQSQLHKWYWCIEYNRQINWFLKAQQKYYLFWLNTSNITSKYHSSVSNCLENFDRSSRTFLSSLGFESTSMVLTLTNILSNTSYTLHCMVDNNDTKTMNFHSLLFYHHLCRLLQTIYQYHLSKRFTTAEGAWYIL